MQAPLNILLVEDDEGDREHVRRALACFGRGVKLQSAESGIKAQDFIRAFLQSPHSRPDLVLLDINLPGISGAALLREIKAQATLKFIPVTAMTTSADPDDILDLYCGHANICVVKPLDGNEYRKMIKSIVDLWSDVAWLPKRERR